MSIWRWDVSSLFGKSGQNELHEGTVGGPDEQSGAGKGERVKLLWESVSMTGQGESARSAVGASICEHRRRSQCSRRGCAGIREHSLRKSECRECCGRIFERDRPQDLEEL